jgi:pyrroline-5-carboxylate reductase
MSVLKNLTIGCIGTGNMGGAIISGLAKKIKKEKIFCFDKDKSRLESVKTGLGISAAGSAAELTAKSDVVILAVKPDVIRPVLEDIKENAAKKYIISIAAGISINFINDIINSPNNIVRVMPNTPALIGEGMSVISPFLNETDDKLLAISEEIFSYLGRVLVLPEKLMDAVTAVSGSGPAYGFTMIQAMIDGGVRMGLPRDKATVLAAQTILGAAKMVLENSDDPITLRGKVTSPGGTTIEAVHILERSGFSGILMDAIEAAKCKSEKLGS